MVWRACLLVLVVALADCSARSGGGGAGGSGGSGGDDAGATGGTAGAVDASDTSGAAGAATNGDASGASGSNGGCPYGDSPETLSGSGFDAWNGQTVHACLMPVQSYAPGCASTTVVDGTFMVTASACTGIYWSVQIGDGDSITACLPQRYPVTPEQCTCDVPSGASGAGGTGAGHPCAAGPGDAAAGDADGGD